MPNANEPRFPTHVAIIVDGNRRWAKQRMLPVSVGHKAGFDRLREITRYAVGDRGVFVLSLYVFSTENFSRDAKEVGYLMDLFANNFRTIADEMNERGCKVLFSGRREGLQQRVLDAMDYMMDLTKDNEKGIVNFCLNYGSHAELTDATRAIAAEVKAGTLEPEAIDEKVIEKHLYRDLPPVDLMIRTSGEERLSNFLLWQCAYAEFYFTPTLFPDFTKDCFDEALSVYARRDRRMGGNTKKCPPKAFPLGGRWPRPRPRPDEGRTCRGSPSAGGSRKLCPHQSPSVTASPEGEAFANSIIYNPPPQTLAYRPKICGGGSAYTVLYQPTVSRPLSSALL